MRSSSIFLSLIICFSVITSACSSGGNKAKNTSSNSSSTSSSNSSSSSSSSSSGAVCTTCDPIYINEAVASNGSYEDEDGDTSDWLEIYNDADEPVILSGWTLTDDPLEPAKWTLPAISLNAGEYLLIWASDKDRTDVNAPLHTNFKLASEGETVLLYNDAGQLVHSLDVFNTLAGISAGLDQSKNLVYFDELTPGQANSNVAYQGVVQTEVSFSHNGGENSPALVMLSGANNNEQIRYTLDSTIPSESSPLYSGAIAVNQNTVIRARIFSNNFIPSKTQSRTFLANANHDLPVITLVTDPLNFFDMDYGIYVLGPDYENEEPNFGANFWEDWEREVHFTFYEPNGDLGTEFNAGAKIFGGWTRASAQKSLALYARGQYGTKEIEYTFFPELSYNQFQSLVLRNAGNDWMYAMLRDRAITSLMDGSGLETQASRPAAVYLNGEYWGLHNLREKVSKHFLDSKFDVDKSELDMLELNGEIVDGDNQDYLALVDYVSMNNPNSSAFYQTISQQMDIENYIIYQVTQVYINNTDWPGNNIKYWRQPNTLWRWILYDTDFGFGHVLADDVTNNTLQFATTASGNPIWPNPPWSTLLFRRLLQNPTFAQQFINRFADELNSRFLSENVINHFNNIAAQISSEIPNHTDRWLSSFPVKPFEQPPVWQDEMDKIEAFAQARPFYVWQHLRSYFNLNNATTITINAPAQGKVKVNSIEISQSNWQGQYFSSIPITIEAIANQGYRFSHWQGSNTSNAQTLSVNVTSNYELTPVFVVD